MVALPLAAQRNDFGVWASYTELRGTNNTDVAGTGVTFDKAVGFGGGWTHWWGTYFATDIAATATRNAGHLNVIGARVGELGRFEMIPVTALAQFHFLGHGKIDPYAGAGGAYVFAHSLHSSDLTSLGIGDVNFKNKVAFCANAGVNLDVGHSLALVLDGKYIPVSLNSRGSVSGVSEKLKVNPLMLSAGVRFRF